MNHSLKVQSIMGGSPASRGMRQLVTQYLHSGKQRDEVWSSAHFLLLIKIGSPAHGMLSPTFRGASLVLIESNLENPSQTGSEAFALVTFGSCQFGNQ